MDGSGIRRAYLDFFTSRGHAAIAPANLVPREDATTLFTGSGMQPLIPYLLGARHPAGDRLVDSQLCLRAEDIDEVGDTRHTTSFEMLGNWSLGSYFKQEQLSWVFEFLTKVVGLDPFRIYASVFAGSARWDIPRDRESERLWTDLFVGAGVEPTVTEAGTSARAARDGTGGARIVRYDESECWWSRSGPPDSMPPGEPGGPDSEIFYLYPQVPHDRRFGAHCHLYCDCGRFVEIGNSVFMQYRRTQDGFEPLPQRNVDFGGGLERLAAAAADTADVFTIDLLAPLVSAIESMSGTEPSGSEPSAAEQNAAGHSAAGHSAAGHSAAGHSADLRAKRIIADHVRAVTFLAVDGVEPSNNTQGYAMRRLARRALRQGLHLGIDTEFLPGLADLVVAAYRDAYPEFEARSGQIRSVLEREEALFRRTLARGVRELPRLARIERPRGGSADARAPAGTVVLSGEAIFKLFDTYGFPPELSVEEARATGVAVDPRWETQYRALMQEQKERSRTAASGLFKGGLADRSEATTQLHTTTHLLYAALRKVLGDHVVQRGSNITPERLRFDFSHPARMTPQELARVEAIVNENIERDWPMTVSEMSPGDAFARGALGAFGDRYGPTVTVYTAGDPDGEWYSKEICGGPHVAHTAELGHFRIVKEESSASGVRRVRAVLEEPAR
jgi:alanyl-tRNA synthetase